MDMDIDLDEPLEGEPTKPDLSHYESELARVAFSIANLREIQTCLNDEFVGKSEIISMMIVCAVAQEPMVIFGEPGTAKSALVTRFCDLLGYSGTDIFKYLLTSFTEPDELLGVVDIRKYMEDQEYARVEKGGGVQKAKVVFLDEIFRGNSAILNTLLSIINERIYYESGTARPAQTQVVYGASNDSPRSHELRAFYSRFPIRLRSDRISLIAPDSLLEKGWKLEMRPKRDDPTEEVEKAAESHANNLAICQNWLLSWWKADQNWLDENTVLRQVKQMYIQAVQKLNSDARDYFRIDDRKFVKLFKLIYAHAMLNSGPGSVPGLDNFYAVLVHTWEDPEVAYSAREAVRQVMTSLDSMYASPFTNPLTRTTFPPLPEQLRFHIPG